MLHARRVGNGEDTQITVSILSLVGRVWMHFGLVNGLYEPTVKVRSTDAAVLFGRSGDRREDGAESGGSPSSASEAVQNGEEKMERSGSSRRERVDDGVIEEIVVTRT